MVISKWRVLLCFIISVGFLMYVQPIKAQEKQEQATEEEVKEGEKKEPTKEKEEEQKEEVKQEPAEEEAKEAKKPEEAAEKEAKEEEKPAEEVKEEAPKEEEAKKEEPAEEVATEEVTTEEEETPTEEEVPAEVPEEEVKEELVEEPAQPAVPIEVKEISEKPAEEAEKEGEVVGIDTVDLDEPQGNWLFKRIWWERAESKYEKARTRVEAILESRMNFFAQRAELDKTVFDPFYIAVGLSQGELQEILASLTARLEQERKEEGMLSAKEREFFDTLRAQKAVLEQMKLDVQAINKVDQEIDEALNKLLEQINRVRGYERDVWLYFKDIARVLNDKKAREIFYKIDTTLKNISDVNNYIKQAFSDHFNKLVTTAKEQVDRVKMAVSALKEKGIDLKKQLEGIEQEEVQRVPVKPAVDEDLEEEPAPKGIFQTYIISPIQTTFLYIGSGLKAVLNGVVFVVRWPIDKLTGSPRAEPVGEE